MTQRSSKLGRGAATLCLAVGAAIAISAFLWTLPDDPYSYVFNDELLYTQQARDIAAGVAPRFNAVAAAKYPPLYSAAIAPAYALGADDAGWWARVINVLLAVSTIIPIYRLARLRLRRGASVAVALLSVLQPFQVYAPLLMSENLFVPLFAWLVLALVRWAERPEPRRAIAAGVVLGVCVLTKSVAILFLIAIAVAAVWSWRSVRLGVKRTAVVAASCGAVLVAWRTHATWWPGTVPMPKVLSYVDEFTVHGLRPVAEYLFWVRATFGAVPMAMGAGAVAVAIAVIARMMRASQPSERFFATFLALATLGITLFAALWSTQVSFYTRTVHARYLVMFWPVMLVCFAFAFGRGRCSRAGLVGGAVAVLVAIVALPADVFQWPYGIANLANFPSSELLRAGTEHALAMRFAIGAPLVLVLGVALGSTLVQRIAASLLVLVTASYLVVQCVSAVGRTYELMAIQAEFMGPSLDWLARRVPDEDEVVFFEDAKSLAYHWSQRRGCGYAIAAPDNPRVWDSSIWLFPMYRRWLPRGDERPRAIWIVSQRQALPFAAPRVGRFRGWNLFKPDWTEARYRTP